MIKRTDEFKKECVKLRLRGSPIKTICELKKIHPPQLNKWMKEFATDTELKESRKLFEANKKPKSMTDNKFFDRVLNQIPRDGEGNILFGEMRSMCSRREVHSHEYILYPNAENSGPPQDKSQVVPTLLLRPPDPQISPSTGDLALPLNE